MSCSSCGVPIRQLPSLQTRRWNALAYVARADGFEQRAADMLSLTRGLAYIATVALQWAMKFDGTLTGFD